LQEQIPYQGLGPQCMWLVSFMCSSHLYSPRSDYCKDQGAFALDVWGLRERNVWGSSCVVNEGSLTCIDPSRCNKQAGASDPARNCSPCSPHRWLRKSQQSTSSPPDLHTVNILPHFCESSRAASRESQVKIAMRTMTWNSRMTVRDDRPYLVGLPSQSVLLTILGAEMKKGTWTTRRLKSWC
jgi:hypothetical protein